MCGQNKSKSRTRSISGIEQRFYIPFFLGEIDLDIRTINDY